MTVGILQDIIEKIREVSASGNSLQVTDSKIIKYINSYYLYDLPNDLRNIKLKDVYSFNTIQGVDTYPFDFDHWSTVEGPAYCGKIQIVLFQDKASFYSYNFSSQQLFTFDYGDGGPGPYSGSTQVYPVVKSVNNNPMVSTPTSNVNVFPSGYPPTSTQNNISRVQNILISANTETGSLHVTDDGAGNLIGDCVAGGTIDYQTGDIANLTFTANVPSGNDINIQYIQQVQGQPYTILFFQNQFTVRPVPDQAYTIEMTACRQPSQALLGTNSVSTPNLDGRPEEMYWWELIAFGVAKKLYQDRLDTDGVAMMDAFLQEKISEARTRTYAQLSTRQVRTIFRDETNNNNMPGWTRW
jgi:hypothetical protein